MLRTLRLFALTLLLALAPIAAWAQGVLVNINVNEHVALPRPIIIHPPIPRPRPIPVSEYRIKQLGIDVRLNKQVAQVQVSQSFVNTGQVPMEVCFVFPLPYDGAVDRLTFMLDGKEIEAKLLDAKQARATYESIVRKNLDPALLEWIGTGMFKTSVFPVPPGAERKVTLRYTQLCRTTHGLTDFLFPLSTAKYTTKPIEQMDIRVAVESESEIKNLYSPSHAVDIKRSDDKHALVSFTAKEYVPSSDFRLLYDVGPGKIGTSVLSYRPNESEEGFFLMLTSPQINSPDMTPARKSVIFVLDRSGSMAGVKLDQAKGALKYVLNNLREGDVFNIVAYDSAVESFRPEVQRFNDETRKAALGYVEGLYPGGGTNIDGALKAAMAHLADPNQPNYVIFLTDGLPTVGETKEPAIVANAKANNKVRARVFAFGVGYDVNSRMLDSLVSANFGQSEYVRPNENIEERVSRFYAKIGAPVMTDVKIAIEMDGVRPEEGPVVNRVYPKDSIDLFAGQQLVVVGRYRKPGAAKVTITGKQGMMEQKFDFPATLVEKSPDSSNVFIERLWALRRVGEIIDEIDHKGKNDELVKELVTLATKHGILTQYTSFLAEEPGINRDLLGSVSRASDRLDLLKEADGRGGVAQRAAKGALRRADAPAQQDAQASEERFPRARGAGGGSAFRDVEDKVVEVQTVRSLGAKTFYRRGKNWVDSTVAEAAEKKAQKIERFSQTYFDLAAKHGPKLTQYLVADEPIVVEIDGEVYAFEGQGG